LRKRTPKYNSQASIYKTLILEKLALISACKNNERAAQKELYDNYSSYILGICMRYLKKRDEAEDAMIQSFFRIMNNIQSYSGSGSFEGWMRRIAINECLMAIRKKKMLMVDIDDAKKLEYTEVSIVELLEYQELLQILDQLPNGYRTVFNLYVIEGYKHREIAEKLNISINTSKSQLILAKKRLVEILSKKKQHIQYRS